MNNHFKCAVVAATLSLTGLACQAQVAVMGANAAPITKDQLANIYLGRSFDLKPVDLPEGSPLREQFYKKATDRDQSQIKAVWSRIVFTGKGQAPIMLPDAAAVKKAVSTDPKAIGYIDKASVDGSVKVVLSLD
jgi:ABC-type phosphate transport system substrate-binding protein